MTKWTIGGGTNPMSLGIEASALIHWQPTWRNLHTLASVSLGMVAMISGQWLSRKAASSTYQGTSWLLATELVWDNSWGWWWWELGKSRSAEYWKNPSWRCQWQFGWRGWRRHAARQNREWQMEGNTGWDGEWEGEMQEEGDCNTEREGEAKGKL